MFKGIKMEKVISGASNYSITDTGDVVSYQGKSRLVLSSKHRKDGYVDCTIVDDSGKVVTKSVHRLVPEAFITNPLNKKEVNHIDSNIANNCVGNLEWVTSSENHQHAYDKLGRVNPKGASKKVLQFDCNNEFIQEFACIKDACKAIGLPHTRRIGYVCNQGGGMFKNYFWKFA